MAQSESVERVSEGKSLFDPYEHFRVALNEDGSLTRMCQMPVSPATGDEAAQLDGLAVVSKDVVLDAEKKTTLRVYRPTKFSGSTAKLPIVFCFRAGGFILFTIDNTVIHEGCNRFSREIPAIVISVGYRLAPENKLPAQYDDAIDAINWAHDQAMNQDGDPWLRNYSDFSRCYLYGKSSGGNIAFNAALRVVDMNLEPMSFVGLILNQPLLGGNKRTRSEIQFAADDLFPLPAIDLLWELALPKGVNRDHRFCNPLIHPATIEKTKHLRKVLFFGCNGDPLIDRQQAFVKMLANQGIPIDARFDDGFHCIDVVDSERSAAIVGFMKEFVI